MYNSTLPTKLVNTNISDDKHIQLWRERRPAFNPSTTSGSTYTNPPAGNEPTLPHQPKQATNVTTSSSKFYDETTSRSTYLPPSRTEQQKPTPHTGKSLDGVLGKEGSKFDGLSTSANTYIAHEASPARRTQPQTHEPRRNTTFYGTTTSREAYVAHEVPKRFEAQSTPQNQVLTNNTTFYGETTSRSSFQAYSSPEKSHSVAQARKSLDGVMSTNENARFDGNTTNGNTYVAHEVSPPATPVVQHQMYEPNKAYFYGSTTNSEVYKAWDAPKPARAHGPVHEAHTGKFYGSTENRESYVSHQPQHQKKFVPTDSLQTGGDFNPSTTYDSTFKGWQLPFNRLSLSLETVNNGVFVMIPRNERLPTRHTQIFTTVTDGQSTVMIVIRQGESLRASENEVLGSFELVGIPPGPCGEPQIQVTFIVNEDNILHVDAVDKLTGKAQHIAIDKRQNRAAFAR